MKKTSTLNHESFSYRNFRIAWEILSALWIAFHTYILYNAGVEFALALADSLCSNVLLALLCVALRYPLQYYRPGKTRTFYLILWVTSVTGIWLWAVYQLLYMIYGWLDGDLVFLRQTIEVRFFIGFLAIGWFVLLNWIWYYMKTREEDKTRKLSMETLAREAELQSLRRQLQPHFLFNTLNSVNALIKTRPEEAQHMLQQLSDFLRGTLKKEDLQMVSLADELAHLQLYLDIEKVRFGHRLKTAISIDETCISRRIPALLLQPIVENAIKFGLYDTLEEVEIRIEAVAENEHLVLTVENPFDPDTSRPRKGTGFGLSSVERRLYLLFARNDLLITQSEGRRFKAIIKIPQQHDH